MYYIGMATIAEVASQKVPKETKIRFYEREERAGRQKLFKALKQIKRDVGKPKAVQGILKARQAHTQILWAKRQKFKVRGNKYWR